MIAAHENHGAGRTEPRQNPLSVRRRVGCFDHQRQSQTPQRLPLQRSLCRLARLQSPLNVQGSGDGQASVRPNPPEKWQVVEVPHLRIVSDDLWDAAQARKKLYGGKRTHERRRPKHMFSGLVRCGFCGSSYTVKNRDQLACSAHRKKGPCNNNRTIRVEELERRGLKRKQTPPPTPRGLAAILL